MQHAAGEIDLTLSWEKGINSRNKQQQSTISLPIVLPAFDLWPSKLNFIRPPPLHWICVEAEAIRLVMYTCATKSICRHLLKHSIIAMHCISGSLKGQTTGPLPACERGHRSWCGCQTLDACNTVCHTADSRSWPWGPPGLWPRFSHSQHNPGVKGNSIIHQDNSFQLV